LALITDTRRTGKPAFAHARCSILETPLSDIPIASAIRFIRHPFRYRSRQTLRCLAVRFLSEITAGIYISSQLCAKMRYRLNVTFATAGNRKFFTANIVSNAVCGESK
jgi:hypothetical protein